MSAEADYQSFGDLLVSVLNRDLSLDERAAAIGALATLADVMKMQDAADAAHAARQAVEALDAAQLRLFDLCGKGGDAR